MLAGPEITRIIAEFEDQLTTEDVDETRHHEQQEAIQKTFFEQVTALVSYFEESGNPFLEASSDIISLDTKDIADSAMRKTVDESNESVRSSLIHLLRRGSFTERRHCMTVYQEISWYYLTVRIRRRNRKAKLSLPLPRMTLLYFPNYTSDVSIEVVMLMNSSNTRTKPFHRLCLTLENYDSLQNQIYFPASKKYRTHIGPKWVFIWVLHGQPIRDSCGICNRVTCWTHMGKAMWELYGSSMGKINPHLSSRKTICTHFYTNDYKSPVPAHLMDW